MKTPVDSLCKIVSYSDLINTLVARRKALGMSQELLCDRAGLMDGYVGKLEKPQHPKSGRGLGRISLECILRALGVSLAIIDNDGKPLQRVPSALGAPAAHGRLGLKGLSDGMHPVRVIRKRPAKK